MRKLGKVTAPRLLLESSAPGARVASRSRTVNAKQLKSGVRMGWTFLDGCASGMSMVTEVTTPGGQLTLIERVLILWIPFARKSRACGGRRARRGARGWGGR